MNKFEKLIELNKEFDGMLINNNIDSVWYETGNEILWNTDNCSQSLLSYDGSTYSAIKTGCEAQDSVYLLVELYNGFGQTDFHLFNKLNQVIC